MAGWTEAVWNMKFTRHFYAWSALRMNPRPSDLESNSLPTWPHVPRKVSRYHVLQFLILGMDDVISVGRISSFS